MARLSNAPSPALRRANSTFERSSAELGQLLSRLQQVLLHPDTSRERLLRTSEYERSRQKSNLDYARAALTKLEQDALSVLAPGRRLEVQSDLNQKRELLEVLVDRLQDLQKLAVDEDDEEEDDSSDVDGALANLIPTPSEDTDTQQDEIPTPDDSAASLSSEPAQPSSTPLPPPQQAPTQTQQTLRSRTSAKPQAGAAPQDDQPTHVTARAALFANRRNRTIGAQPEKSTATAEAILDHQSREREELADKVFKMAQAMKNQQKNIAASLETEKDVLGRATEGMERTGRGMEVAKGRIGALQKMSEGKGWWGRMMLFAWVYGLMVALLLLVFVLPKLRF